MGLLIVAVICMGAFIGAAAITQPGEEWLSSFGLLSVSRFLWCFHSQSKKSYRLMINWVYLLIFVVVYFVFIDMDDDDDQDGGKMIPAYQRPDQWPILHHAFWLTTTGSDQPFYRTSPRQLKLPLKLKSRSLRFTRLFTKSPRKPSSHASVTNRGSLERDDE